MPTELTERLRILEAEIQAHIDAWPHWAGYREEWWTHGEELIRLRDRLESNLAFRVDLFG
jgi:hypothetical protein